MKYALALLILIATVGASNNLETVYQWNYFDYLWDSKEQKDQYIASGNYDYRNIVPIDVDKARDGRIFVTAIRNLGVPASLSTVTNNCGPSGPLLRPYPNWSWYNSSDCNGITSVYRVAIDECNRLYVLDTGYIGNDYTCPAQILIFDLGTDKLINRIKVPNQYSQNKEGIGKLVTPIIEFNGPNCTLENLFMADVNGRGLVIWNNQRFVRLEAQVFNPETSLANVEIASESFVLEDSLMGMAVTPKIYENEGRDLIFRPFASLGLYMADTRVLSRSTYGDTIRYKKNSKMLPSQGTAMGITSRGILFFGLTKELAIGCWNRYKEMSAEKIEIVAQDNIQLQFASGLKVLPTTRTKGLEEVWVLTNRLQKIMTGSQNFNEINFRVLKGSADSLIEGTECAPPRNYDRHVPKPRRHHKYGYFKV